MKKEDIIKLLQLEPLPGEGGYFRRTWESSLGFSDKEAAGSAIYFLLTDEEQGFSALHSLPKDEIYHFYAGSTVTLWLFDPKGSKALPVTLGNRIDQGEVPQYVIPAGTIQGSELKEGSWALLGTTVVPAYIDEDFLPADRKNLEKLYPSYHKVIKRLCREVSQDEE